MNAMYFTKLILTKTCFVNQSCATQSAFLNANPLFAPNTNIAQCYSSI